MRYSFRLAEILGHDPNPRKRPGTIKAIVEHTGLDRHQVAALLKNEVKYIPINALSRLCDYLIEHGYCSAEQLPGALFAVEPENFWELLARRNRLELCLGVRRDDEFAESAWVVASDSVLLGELLNGVSTLGGTAKHQRSRTDGNGSPSYEVPQPEDLKQSLVWSPGQGAEGEDLRRARQVYSEFAEVAGDKALICLGSIKSNPVVELVIAEAFGCQPFVSQDDVVDARQRRCPFFMRYRDHDPHPESCSGGMQLGPASPTGGPGIYYEQADGSWVRCEWIAEQQDAALLFYIHREGQGRLEMVLGGFSGRATRLLATTLASRAEEFWPPIYDSQGIQIGAFVVRFAFGSPDESAYDILQTDVAAETEIVRISEAVIARRLPTTG